MSDSLKRCYPTCGSFLLFFLFSIFFFNSFIFMCYFSGWLGFVKTAYLPCGAFDLILERLVCTFKNFFVYANKISQAPLFCLN